MDFKDNCLPTTATIREGLTKLDICEAKILIIQDRNQTLLGVVTDGDVRRGMLKGMDPDDSITTIMNDKPHVFPANIDKGTILSLMRAERVSQAILVEDGVVVGIESINTLISPEKHESYVVIMAGGRGARLLPLTKDCPKPLIEVAGKPVIELILEKCIGQGFYKFFVAVNYLSEQLINHLGDGSKYGVEIEYLREDAPLGTAGALSLINRKLNLPLIVMNGDILTNMEFADLLRFHYEQESDATMVVRESENQVPYGVVYVNEHKLNKVIEKPVERHMINAGIYVLDPKVLNLVEKNKYVDMPDIFNKIVEKKFNAVVFPVRDYWIDIGRIDDLEQARKEVALFT